MHIGEAIAEMYHGKLVCRAGWNGNGMHLGILFPETGGFIDRPFIYLYTAQQTRIPWTASQADLLASDYEIAHETCTQHTNEVPQ